MRGTPSKNTHTHVSTLLADGPSQSAHLASTAVRAITDFIIGVGGGKLDVVSYNCHVLVNQSRI